MHSESSGVMIVMKYFEALGWGRPTSRETPRKLLHSRSYGIFFGLFPYIRGRPAFVYAVDVALPVPRRPCSKWRLDDVDPGWRSPYSRTRITSSTMVGTKDWEHVAVFVVCILHTAYALATRYASSWQTVLLTNILLHLTTMCISNTKNFRAYVECHFRHVC